MAPCFSPPGVRFNIQCAKHFVGQRIEVFSDSVITSKCTFVPDPSILRLLLSWDPEQPIIFFFFCDPVAGTPRHACRFLRAKNRMSDPPMFKIKQNVAKKLDTRHLKEMAYLTRFYAQKSKSPRRYEEMDPESLHTCSTCPFRGLTSVVVVFLVFAENAWSKVVQMFPKNLN